MIRREKKSDIIKLVHLTSTNSPLQRQAANMQTDRPRRTCAWLVVSIQRCDDCYVNELVNEFEM